MVNEPTWPASDLKTIVKSDTTVYSPALRMIRAGAGRRNSRAVCCR